MSRHTPGPWEDRITDRYGPGQVFAEGEFICTTSGNAKANARLIAAAPDLFDVVRLLLHIQEHGPFDVNALDENSPLIDAARDAMAKVEGKQ